MFFLSRLFTRGLLPGMLLLFVVVVLSPLVPLGRAKTYDRCELARDLLFKYKLPAHQISQWVCLVRWESEYNTSAIGSLNADGSLDHGLFQISDLFWCHPGEACGISCDDLRDEDIKDDVICAKRIFRQHQRLTGNGFNAWVAWKIHCQGDTDSYTADCGLSDSPGHNRTTTTAMTGSNLAVEGPQPSSSPSKWLWFTQLLPVQPSSWYIPLWGTSSSSL